MDRLRRSQPLSASALPLFPLLPNRSNVRISVATFFAQEADIATLDQMTSSTASTRNIAMNIYEALLTRDENNHPILDLAAAMDEAPDHFSLICSSWGRLSISTMASL